MELFIAIGLPIVLIFVLTLLFTSHGIPSWVQQIFRNNSTLWNFGIIAMTTMTVITYLAKDKKNEINNYFNNNFGFDRIILLS